MGFPLKDFIRLRPYVYHLTSRDNLRRLKRTGRVDCAAELILRSDRPGLLRDVGDALAREHINVTAVRTQSREDLAFMRFAFEVADLAQLRRAIGAVREVHGVIRVARG